MPLFTRGRRSQVSSDLPQRRHRPDYMLLLLSCLLAGVGLVVVYAISPGLSVAQNVSEQYYVSKQVIAIGLGLLAFAVCANLPLKRFRDSRIALIILAVMAAGLVQIFGKEVNGAARWIQIGGFSFQAVELMKFAIIFYVADFLAQRMNGGQLDVSRAIFKPLFLLIAAIGIIVAWLESDLGSAAIMVAMIGAMAYVAGIPMKRLTLIGIVVAAGTAMAISGSQYRRERLATFLHPERDCQSSGYQACQALIAVGSGGLFGLGLGKSVQAYGYLPEAENDSIFAVTAEKFGFVGVTTLIGLFMLLFRRLYRVIVASSDSFQRLIVTGILAWLSSQVIVNIGAMVGLLPLKGITLPFISYGGTSLVFVMAAIGVAFSASRYTNFSLNSRKSFKGVSHEGPLIFGYSAAKRR